MESWDKDRYGCRLTDGEIARLCSQFTELTEDEIREAVSISVNDANRLFQETSDKAQVVFKSKGSAKEFLHKQQLASLYLWTATAPPPEQDEQESRKQLAQKAISLESQEIPEPSPEGATGATLDPATPAHFDSPGMPMALRAAGMAQGAWSGTMAKMADWLNSAGESLSWTKPEEQEPPLNVERRNIWVAGQGYEDVSDLEKRKPRQPEIDYDIEKREYEPEGSGQFPIPRNWPEIIDQIMNGAEEIANPRDRDMPNIAKEGKDERVLDAIKQLQEDVQELKEMIESQKPVEPGIDEHTGKFTPSLTGASARARPGLAYDAVRRLI